MGFMMALAPVIISGGIVLFVVFRAKKKYRQDEFDRKKSKEDYDMQVMLIPLGMIFGCGAGIVFGTFSPISFVMSVSLGTVLGYLCGYLAYESYLKKSKTS